MIATSRSVLPIVCGEAGATGQPVLPVVAVESAIAADSSRTRPLGKAAVLAKPRKMVHAMRSHVQVIAS